MADKSEWVTSRVPESIKTRLNREIRSRNTASDVVRLALVELFQKYKTPRAVADALVRVRMEGQS